MADIKTEDGEEMVQVSLKTLTTIQEQLAVNEKKIVDMEAANAGLAEMFAKGASTDGEPKLREKRNFEPKFHTVRIRKYPIAGEYENMGYVIGWSNRGAYQIVDRSGVSPQTVDVLDIFFLGQERGEDGKLKAQQVKLLDLMNNGSQVHCKIIDTKKNDRKEPTGEEIDVSVYDPQHGLLSTGEKIDGYVTFSDVTYTIQIPGVTEPVVIDGAFVN